MKEELYHKVRKLAKEAKDQGRLPEAAILYALSGSIANGSTMKLATVIEGFLRSEMDDLKTRMN